MSAPTHRAFIEKDIIKKRLFAYQKKHGYLPGGKDFKQIKGLPTTRSIERRGGIEKFYESMGIEYIKQSKGIVRARVAQAANEYSFHSENDFYKELVVLFGEVAIHRQSPYTAKKNNLCRSDFKIYPAQGKPFFVDVFSASDMHNFSGCVNIKLRKLRDLEVDPSMDIYFVSLNEEFVSPLSIDHYLSHRKTPLPIHIKVLTRTDALKNINLRRMGV